MNASNKDKAAASERMRKLRLNPEFEKKRLDALSRMNRREKIENCARDILRRMEKSDDPVKLVIRARATVRQEILYHLFLRDRPLMDRVIEQLKTPSLG